MGDVESFMELAAKYGVDKIQFKTLFESSEMKNAVRADFEKAAAMGIQGFPTVVLKKEEAYFLISNGYLEGERVAKLVEQNLWVCFVTKKTVYDSNIAFEINLILFYYEFTEYATNVGLISEYLLYTLLRNAKKITFFLLFSIQ